MSLSWPGCGFPPFPTLPARISHTQRNPGAMLLATELFHTLIGRGYSVWLDRYYTESGTTIEGLYRARYSRK